MRNMDTHGMPKKKFALKNKSKNMTLIKNVGITKGDQLSSVSSATASQEFATLEKRPRPSKFSFTIKNATAGKLTYSLMGAIGAVIMPENAVGVFDYNTNRKAYLLSVQRAFIVGLVLSVSTDAQAAQLDEDVNFTKVDFNDSKTTSLKPFIDMAKPLSKDEGLNRVVDVKFVLDESTDLWFDVLPNTSLTVTLNIKEFLNRPW